MKPLISLHNALSDFASRAAAPLLPTLARFLFAAVLLRYFWHSALTKLGDGATGLIFPSDGAYVQIFPRVMEAVGYDTSQLGLWYWLVAVFVISVEFLLPVFIVIGFLTRISAVGMIVFVVVQSLTDIFGHGLTGPKTLGAWFDRDPGSVILDQRMLWGALLTVIVVKGAGPVSVDRLLGRLS